jgi:hypothetical protein
LCGLRVVQFGDRVQHQRVVVADADGDLFQRGEVFPAAERREIERFPHGSILSGCDDIFGHFHHSFGWMV